MARVARVIGSVQALFHFWANNVVVSDHPKGNHRIPESNNLPGVILQGFPSERLRSETLLPCANYKNK